MTNALRGVSACIARLVPDGEEAPLPTLKIFFFGGLRLARGDAPLPAFPTHKAASLFAYLVTYRRRAHSRHVLAGAPGRRQVLMADRTSSTVARSEPRFARTTPSALAP